MQTNTQITEIKSQAQAVLSQVRKVIVGQDRKLLSVLGEYDADGIAATLGKVIPARKANMLDMNRAALKLGADFE